jgi:hypothetical protein
MRHMSSSAWSRTMGDVTLASPRPQFVCIHERGPPVAAPRGSCTFRTNAFARFVFRWTSTPLRGARLQHLLCHRSSSVRALAGNGAGSERDRSSSERSTGPGLVQRMDPVVRPPLLWSASPLRLAAPGSPGVPRPLGAVHSLYRQSTMACRRSGGNDVRRIVGDRGQICP